MKQSTYKGERTAKSRLFEMWDRGDDDEDVVLADDYEVSLSTIAAYRREWSYERNTARTKQPIFLKIQKESLPLRTSKGIVWKVPMRKEMKCEKCEFRGMCKWWVSVLQIGYLGCEQVLERELVGSWRDEV